MPTALWVPLSRIARLLSQVVAAFGRVFSALRVLCSLGLKQKGIPKIHYHRLVTIAITMEQGNAPLTPSAASTGIAHFVRPSLLLVLVQGLFIFGDMTDEPE